MRPPSHLCWPASDIVLCFGGGSQGPDPQALKLQQQQAAMQAKQQAALLKQMSSQSQIQMPEMPNIPPPTPIAPPPTPQANDVGQAEQEAQSAAAKRYGFLRTTYAGGTGGYMGSPLGGGGNSGGKQALG